MSKQHLETSLARVRTIFEEVVVRIDAIKPGEKIPATTLAEEIAKEYNMTCPQLYPTLKFLINDDYPGVEIRRGAQGGIYKLLPGEVKGATKVKATKDGVPAVVAVVADDSAIKGE